MARFLVYGITTESWAARYGIEVFSYPCSECGRMATTTIPFAQGQMRGLQAPPCECGNVKTPYGMVRDPRYGDLLAPQSKEPAKVHTRPPGQVWVFPVSFLPQPDKDA